MFVFTFYWYFCISNCVFVYFHCIVFVGGCCCRVSCENYCSHKSQSVKHFSAEPTIPVNILLNITLHCRPLLLFVKCISIIIWTVFISFFKLYFYVFFYVVHSSMYYFAQHNTALLAPRCYTILHCDFRFSGLAECPFLREDVLLIYHLAIFSFKFSLRTPSNGLFWSTTQFCNFVKLWFQPFSIECKYTNPNQSHTERMWTNTILIQVL